MDWIHGWGAGLEAVEFILEALKQPGRSAYTIVFVGWPRKDVAPLGTWRVIWWN